MAQFKGNVASIKNHRIYIKRPGPWSKKGNINTFLNRTMTFRLQAKNFLLTYSQCDKSKEELLEFLQTKGCVNEYCIGQEHHQDGGLHLHAWVSYKEKIRTSDSRYFDMGEFHPNIVRARSKKGSIEYCSKDDPEPLKKFREKRSYGDILDEADSEEQFLKLVQESHPRDYVLFYDRIKGMAKEHFKPDPAPYQVRYRDFINVPLDMLTLNLDPVDRPKTLVIIGKRGLGKTEWARSLGKHVYSRGCVCYDKFKAEAREATYAVFDDLWDWNFRFLKDFLGGQPTATITGKYRQPSQLEWGKRSIFLTNERFWEEWTPKQQEYFQDSSIVVELNNKLYN